MKDDLMLYHPNWIQIMLYPERYDMEICEFCNGSGLSQDGKKNCGKCSGHGVVGKDVKTKDYY
jgi:hypothetical protein